MSPARPKAERGPAEELPDEALKRLGGGRWQTRDERFTIEPQSGTWSVVDAAETDDFGLPLVRGPFKSLTDAKAAIAAARSDQTPESPLSSRLEAKATAPPAASPEARAASGRKPAAGRAEPETAEPADTTSPAAPSVPGLRSAPRKAPVKPEKPQDPGWFRDISPSDRGRARRLIELLAAEGVPDAAGIVRRDLAGDVPALAAHAIRTRIAALGDDASPDDVVELLAEGRDEALGVRWRLVDGDGRPILIEPGGKHRRRSRG
jgi:hypothetical protein